MALPLVYVSVAVCLLLFYRYAVHPLFNAPLSKIPAAHPSARFSSLWIRYQRRRGRGNRTVFAAHRRHGPIVRLGPSELSVASLEGLRKIYIGAFEKDPWYLEFRNYAGTPNLVSMLEHKPHSLQKRMLSNVYSKSSLQNCPHLVKVSVSVVRDTWLSVLHATAADGRPEGVNVLELNAAAGADFTSAYLFGVQNSTGFLRDLSAREEYFHLHSVKMRQSPGYETAIKRIEEVVEGLCDGAERNGGKAQGGTLPVVYEKLKSQLEKSELPLDERKRRAASEMLDQFMAGHETTAISLTYVMYEMSRNPSMQTRLRAELQPLDPPVHFLAETLPHPGTIDALPLLDAVLQETLRLYAPAPALQPRITPAGGTMIEGYGPIPGGVRIGTAAYVLHREPHVWPEPLVWRPERWLDCSRAERDEMNRYFWAFGSGGRMCVGSNLALQSEYCFFNWPRQHLHPYAQLLSPGFFQC